jgi:hypothetical protein
VARAAEGDSARLPGGHTYFLRAALAERELGRVVVETANQLQGLEFEVVFVWHPLARLPEAEGVHLDPGPLCVLLTRHRQACVVVGRAGDHGLLEDRVPPPRRPTWAGTTTRCWTVGRSTARSLKNSPP